MKNIPVYALKKLLIGRQLWIWTAVFLVSCSNGYKPPDSSGIKTIPPSAWMYYAGQDSAKSHEQPGGIAQMRKSGAWVPAAARNARFLKNHDGIMWMKAKLPERKGVDPAIYLRWMNHAVRVYCDDREVYGYGTFNSAAEKYSQWKQHLIRLPAYADGGELVLKVRLEKEPPSISETVQTGSYEEILRAIFYDDFRQIFVIAVLCMGAMVVLLAYALLQKTKLLLGISCFLFLMGLFFASHSASLQFIINAPEVFFHVNYLAFHLAPVFFFYVLEQVVADSYKRIINIIWKTKLGMLVLVSLVINSTRFVLLDVVPFTVVFNVAFIVIGMASLFLSVREGTFESKILFAGITVFTLSVLISFSYYFGTSGVNPLSFYIKSAHVGALAFTASLLWLALHRYRETNREQEQIRLNEMKAIQRENDARQQFAAKLLESQETERNRIALELHDSIGQKLLLLKNRLLSKQKQAAENSEAGFLREISDLAGETIQEIRHIIYNLRPQYLDQLGLTAAIEHVVETVSARSATAFHVQIDNVDDIFSTADEISFFRIIQESLSNIMKHAKATEAHIAITVEKGQVTLDIRDNGAGFPDESASQYGLGIAGMRERTRIMGGTMNLRSDANGTRLLLLFPAQSKTTEENQNG